ncbi:hypothetical protein ACI5KX_03625 [Erythrobacter sp. GH1-10]|uniref:hypothetical protein n=1 Tax=Erythrobacter sp. GH1-10 TaxID=3349334 RepID=UPI003877ECC2
MIRTPIMLCGVLAIAACAPVEADGRADPALAGPPVKVLGEARNCINRNTIRTTRVRSDQMIDFEMSGGRVYRNTLPYNCPRLGFEEAFAYKTSISQLCSTDIIYVLENTGGGPPRRGAGCGLGQFVPVEYVEESETD